MITIESKEVWESATHRLVVHWRAGGHVYFHHHPKSRAASVMDFGRIGYAAFRKAVAKATRVK